MEHHRKYKKTKSRDKGQADAAGGLHSITVAPSTVVVPSSTTFIRTTLRSTYCTFAWSHFGFSMISTYDVLESFFIPS